MRQIYEGKKNVADLNTFLSKEKTNYMPDKYHMYFTSNHDENSWHGTVFEQFGDSYEVFAVLTQTLYGMPLLYNGQEAGLNKRLEFFEKDPIHWNNFPYEDFYASLNHLRDTNQALWHAEKGGIPQRVNTSNSNVFAFVRQKASSRVLVLLNLSSAPVLFTLSTPDYNSNYTEILTNKGVNIHHEEAINLEAWGYMVLAL
jgi:glycosidase